MRPLCALLVFVILLTACGSAHETTPHLEKSYENARILYNQGHYEHAAEVLLGVLKASEGNLHTLMSAKAHRLLGYVYYQQKKYLESFECFDAAVPTFTLLGYHDYLASSLYKMGQIQFLAGYEHDAVMTFESALIIVEEDSAITWKALLQLELAKSYEVMGEFQKSQKLFEQALTTSQNAYSRFYASYSLGKLFHSQQKYVLALEHCKAAESFAREDQNLENVASSKHRACLAYYYLGNIEMARKEAGSALEILQSLNRSDYLQNATFYRYDLAVILDSLGEQRQAVEVLKPLAAIFEERGHTPKWQQGMNLLRNLAGELQDPGAAYYGGLLAQAYRLKPPPDGIDAALHEGLQQYLREAEAERRQNAELTLTYRNALLFGMALMMILFLLFALAQYRKRLQKLAVAEEQETFLADLRRDLGTARAERESLRRTVEKIREQAPKLVAGVEYEELQAIKRKLADRGITAKGVAPGGSEAPVFKTDML